MINRAKLREKPLDPECKYAHTSRHEYGPDDDRVFCLGLFEDMSVCRIREECNKCGAYVFNAKPPEAGEQ